MKTFIVYWKDGKFSTLNGHTITEAFNKYYGGGAINAVDFYEQSGTPNYTWDKESKTWYK